MINKIFKQNKKVLVVSLLLSLINVVSTLIAPLIIGSIVDGFINNNLVINTFIILFFTYAISNVSMWLVLRMTNTIAFRVNRLLRNEMIEKLKYLSISFYDTTAHGEIVNAFINDIDQVSEGLLNSIYVLMQGTLTIVISVVLMLRINTTLSIVVLISAPMSIFIARFIVKRSQNIFNKQAYNLAMLNSYTEETISGYKVIQGYQHESKTIEIFKKLNDNLYASGFKSQFISSLSNPSSRVINNIVYICVGVIGSLYAIDSVITVGTISTFLIYSSLFGKPFNDITNVVPQIQSANSSYQRIEAFLKQAVETDNESQLPQSYEAKGEVIFDNISFGYQKDKMIINDFNLSVKPGTKVAIVGKTGAGKTTLINLILRFYDVNKGNIRLDGYDISKLSREELRSQFGLVLQDAWLFNGTVFDNLSYGNEDATLEEVINVCKMLDIDGFIRQLEHGYETVISSSNTGISEGQKQLLSIARVILSKPKVVILDEATSNIDTYSEVKIQRSFDRLTEGKTSFIIAHRLSTIRNSDLIIVLDKGDVVEYGGHNELLKKKGYYSELYQSQFDN